MRKIDDIMKDLKAQVEERTGLPFPEFLLPIVRLTSSNLQMIDHIHEKILEDNLISIETGSMGQSKVVVTPLLPYYDKLQRTATVQLEKIGLTYSATPSKITLSTKNGGMGDDPMEQFLKAAR
jgi:hypothetical protein